MRQSEFRAPVEKINQISGQELDGNELLGSYDRLGRALSKGWTVKLSKMNERVR
ncbi:MAG: hypothetical protein JXR89_13135 [Deltaproteobacteria bacterium]|nr:hypothetical protein [Deltaproteobacteria bacterium]